MDKFNTELMSNFIFEKTGAWNSTKRFFFSEKVGVKAETRNWGANVVNSEIRLKRFFSFVYFRQKMLSVSPVQLNVQQWTATFLKKKKMAAAAQFRFCLEKNLRMMTTVFGGWDKPDTFRGLSLTPRQFVPLTTGTFDNSSPWQFVLRVS